MFFLYIHGSNRYKIRVGAAGTRPLIYGVYKYDNDIDLPIVPLQEYKEISSDQYQWLIAHIKCEVSYICDRDGGGLFCRSCNEYKDHMYPYLKANIDAHDFDREV